MLSGAPGEAGASKLHAVVTLPELRVFPLEGDARESDADREGLDDEGTAFPLAMLALEGDLRQAL